MAVFSLELFFHFFYFRRCFIFIRFVAVSTLYKTHFHVYPPTPTWTYAYPLGTFSTPTPIETPIFHLEHPPQVETVVVKWNLK